MERLIFKCWDSAVAFLPIQTSGYAPESHACCCWLVTKAGSLKKYPYLPQRKLKQHISPSAR